MRICQIAPPWFAVPPVGYGGIERVVYDLTEGLIEIGNEVTLCAPAGSTTNARLFPTVVRPLSLNMTEARKSRFLIDSSRLAYQQALVSGAELIHDHTDWMPPRDFPLPIIRTIHGPATVAAVANYRAMSKRGDRFVAISQRQRDLFTKAAERQFGPGEHINFAGVAHNPVDVNAAPFFPASEKRGYVAFLGRCHWEKSPDGAIRIAQAAGMPLMMALRVTTEEESYFDAVVQPLLRSTHNLAKLVGEVSGAEKDQLIGHAAAVLFPSPWEEPFGLVIAEAAARGTPVISLARGSAPELIIDGGTGFLCNDEAGMVEAIAKVSRLDPQACRNHAAALFDRTYIARKYQAMYEQVLADQRPARREPALVKPMINLDGIVPATSRS